jgi:tetratricopeptide (TPR) repeat protein
MIVCLMGFALAGGCAAPPPEPEGDRQLELLERSARKAYTAGDAKVAVRLYRQALERARLRADTEAIAEMRYNLAAAQARVRKYEAALNTLQTVPQQTANRSAKRQLLAGQIYFEQGRLDEAERALKQAQQGELDPALLAVYRGLIAAKQGDWKTARRIERQLPETTPAGARSRLAGLIAEADGDFIVAAKAHERESAANRQRGHYAATAEALARAGGAYVKAQKPRRAARAFRLAGDSARVQELDLPAQQWLNRAKQLIADTASPATAPGTQPACRAATR